MKKTLVLAISAALLSACGSNEVKRIESEDTVGGIDVIKVVKLEDKEIVPVWYLDPGVDTAAVVFATSTAISDDMEYAVVKATHQAQATLGSKIAARSSGQFKQHTSDSRSTATSNSAQQSSFTSISKFKNVPVAGYRVVNKAVFREGSRYRAYVNLALGTGGQPYIADPSIVNSTEASQAYSSLEQ